jgi:hypothetical protein
MTMWCIHAGFLQQQAEGVDEQLAEGSAAGPEGQEGQEEEEGDEGEGEGLLLLGPAQHTGGRAPEGMVLQAAGAEQRPRKPLGVDECPSGMSLLPSGSSDGSRSS